MLDKLIESEEAKSILNKYFVAAHLTVPDSAGQAGASQVLEKLGGSGQGGSFSRLPGFQRRIDRKLQAERPGEHRLFVRAA